MPRDRVGRSRRAPRRCGGLNGPTELTGRPENVDPVGELLHDRHCSNRSDAAGEQLTGSARGQAAVAGPDLGAEADEAALGDRRGAARQEPRSEVVESVELDREVEVRRDPGRAGGAGVRPVAAG